MVVIIWKVKRHGRIARKSLLVKEPRGANVPPPRSIKPIGAARGARHFSRGVHKYLSSRRWPRLFLFSGAIRRDGSFVSPPRPVNDNFSIGTESPGPIDLFAVCSPRERRTEATGSSASIKHRPCIHEIGDVSRYRRIGPATVQLPPINQFSRVKHESLARTIPQRNASWKLTPGEERLRSCFVKLAASVELEENLRRKLYFPRFP